MEERCPTCTFLFERVEGHWIGSLGLNTTVVFGVMLVVLMAGTLAFYPDPPSEPLLTAGGDRRRRSAAVLPVKAHDVDGGRPADAAAGSRRDRPEVRRVDPRT